MDVHPIRNDRDHKRALRQIEKLWGARAGTSEADELEVWVTLVDAYEAKHHPIDPPDPVDAILFRLEQEGKTRNDLERVIGSRARVSEILNHRRPLTIRMIARLRGEFGISADVLIAREQQPSRGTRRKAAKPIEDRP
jgi:HTH-type transcriptional regulator / antitoxin HigA